jgi:hypothetical protein
MSETGEILKSGAAAHITDFFFNKLAGPMAEELGLMLGDKVRAYRVKNWIKIFQRMQRMLKEAGLPVNAVPPRLLLPLIESCSVEDNETLQELWAGLLATASQQTDSVSPSFVETLKQLTPEEARYLDDIYGELQSLQRRMGTREMSINPYVFTGRGGLPSSVTSDTYERLGLIRRDFKVSLKFDSSSIKRASSIDGALDAIQGTESEIGYRFLFTTYGINFLEACRGPRPTSTEGM